MDSWTLQGDSYSFLRSATHTFSLCHRDGTPNHVEIFDIINTPSQRSAISETTCLCDIFVDDCEAASLSTNPAAAAFVPPQTEVDKRATASPLVDDLNDSSGSYHTAHSSSEGEEGLEDLSERHNEPELQSEPITASPGLPGTSNTAHHNISPLPHERATSSASEDHSTLCEDNFPAFEHKTPQTLSPGESCQSLSSSIVDIRPSPSSPLSNQTEDFSETETRSSTPPSKDRHSSLSHQSSSPVPLKCVSCFSSPIISQPELREVPPNPQRIYNQNTSPSPEPDQFNNHFVHFAPSTFAPKVIISSTDIQSSPYLNLRGRISVPDLFSRGFTPDLEDHSQTPDFISNPESAKEDSTGTANQDTDLSEEITEEVTTSSNLQHTESSPFNSFSSSPEPRGDIISTENKQITPSSSPGCHSPTTLCTSPISIYSLSTTEPRAQSISSENIPITVSPNHPSAILPAIDFSRSPSPSPESREQNILSENLEITPSSSPTRLSAPSPFHKRSRSPVLIHSSSPEPREHKILSENIPIAPSSPSCLIPSSPASHLSRSPIPINLSSPEPREQSDSSDNIPITISLSRPSPISRANNLSKTETPSPEQRGQSVLSENISITPSSLPSHISPTSLSHNLSGFSTLNSLNSSPEPGGQNLSSEHLPFTSSPFPSHLNPISTANTLSSFQINSLQSSPEPKDQSLSSETAPSPSYLSPTSPASTLSRSPTLINSLSSTPEPKRQSVASENIQNCPSPISPANTLSRSPTPAFSPLENYSAKPPESRSPPYSPVISYNLTPSPGCSPVICINKSASPEIRITPSSPELENKFESPSFVPIFGIPTSPHFTRISYSITEPEDSLSPACPQSCLSTRSSTSGSPKQIQSPNPSRNLLHGSILPVQEPQARHTTPSPETRSYSPLSQHCESISPHNSSRNPSPASITLEQTQQLSETHSADQSINSTFRDTPKEDKDFSSVLDFTEVEYSSKSASPFNLESEDKPFVVKSVSTVAPGHSSATTQYHNFPASEETTEVTNIEPPSSYPILPVYVKDQDIIPVHKEISTIPIQTFENLHPHPITFPPSPKSTCTFNPNLTPNPFRRQLSGTVENKKYLKENMASHVNKRRTPSPPLTRFTPVHIIAPEKPYRQWQNRGRSPPQGKTSLPSANLKKVVTNMEIPHDPVNNSQDDWFRKARQLELEKGLQLQEERTIDQVLRDCGMYREGKREERVSEKGEGWHGDASYREEQVELSFNAKNRKGPVSRNTAPTSRDTRPGLPTVHSSSESLLATRQSKQQQSLHRRSSQLDIKGGGPGRRHQPPIAPHKSTAPGRVATNRPGRSSSSSMGSELDEADHEVKWFTDVAFSSLSSPEVDYLHMYNSSHRSSTNISQPSTQDSPAGVNPAWLSYADFSGSAQMLDNDELALQQSSAYYSDGLDPTRCYELGSFECVDVAVEKEDTRRVRRGVPKRQIQLKRRDTTESKQDESSENSSPGAPMMDNFCQETHSRDILVRQHSTPASLQESEPYEESPEVNKEQNVTKSKLQKSSSFDESCSKTKHATCVIKSVLTKKMQSDDLAGEEETSGLDESTKTMAKSPKPEAQILSSSLQSDCSLSSDALCGKSKLNTKDEVVRQKNFGGKFNNRPSSTNSNRSVTFSQADSEEAPGRSSSALQSELKVTFDSTVSSSEIHENSATLKKAVNDDSANTTVENTSPGATGATCTGHARMTNREQECDNTHSHKQAQQGAQSPFKLKTPDSLSISPVEKKKASLSVCLTPEAESKCFTPDEKVETYVDSKNEEEEVNDKVKGPIHKVRDVRRLVKNTYNLSFKATSDVMPSDEYNSKEQCREIENSGDFTQEDNKAEQEARHKETQETKEEIIKTEKDGKVLQQKEKTCSQPMQIEYKAVCWKEDKNKQTQTIKDLKKEVDNPPHQSEPNIEVATTLDVQSKTKVIMSTKASDIADKPALVRTEKTMLGTIPKMPSKEREVSTAVVLIRDSSSRTKRAPSPPQDDFPITVPASSPSPGLSSTPCSSGHSVSMLLKEKGYQADIGAVVGEGHNTSKCGPSKHVNCLEIPLQTSDSHRERTFSSSSTASNPAAASENNERISKTGEEEIAAVKSESTTKEITTLPPKSTVEQTPHVSKQTAPGDFEAVKRLDPTFPPRSPAIRRFKPQPIEVKSETNKQDTITSSSSLSSRPQAIEVKSIAKNSQKPIVPPKPSCKFKTLDLGAMPSETQRLPPTAAKPHNEERSQTIVVSSPTIYRKIPNDSTSNYTRKVAVSSVSSLKPPQGKPAPTSNVSTQPSTSETEALTDRQQRQQQQTGPPSQRYTQKPPTLPSAPVTTHATNVSSATISDPPAPTRATQTSQTAAMDSQQNQLPHPRIAYPHEPATMGTSNNAQPPPVSTTQGSGFIRQSYRRSLSNECAQRQDDMHFYASDDPPSYDERESFSPLRLPDLPPRSNRYQPTSRPPPCSCTAGCPSHPGLPHPHSHNSPQNLTPPAPTHSPGQAMHFPVSQPPLRQHHCRPDPQPVTYQPSSPKSSPLGPGPPLYQPLHQPPSCPPHPSLMHGYPAERPLQPAQHMDPRRPPVHRSPQQPPPAVISGAPYSDPPHSHSPGLSHMDPHYLCGPQSLGPSYGSDYGGDSSSLYSESNYSQTPRRVLMDPETGKYFYIEVPVQPLRKMLFDPETGQYVEVLIPQQAMSHSGLYPPSAPNYPPTIHNTNMYAPAPQYMPYAAPPTQPQPPRYPEASAAAPLHPHGPGVPYRNPSGQGSKPDSQGHPPVDPNYLESMYYVPTGMNASPNPTPPDYYHKHLSNLPPTAGKQA